MTSRRTSRAPTQTPIRRSARLSICEQRLDQLLESTCSEGFLPKAHNEDRVKKWSTLIENKTRRLRSRNEASSQRRSLMLKRISYHSLTPLRRISQARTNEDEYGYPKTLPGNLEPLAEDQDTYHDIFRLTQNIYDKISSQHTDINEKLLSYQTHVCDNFEVFQQELILVKSSVNLLIDAINSMNDDIHQFALDRHKGD